MIKPNSISGSVLRIGGAFTALFSLVVGVLVLFVIPGACTFVSGLQLIVLGFLFVAGVLAFLLGNTWLRKKVGIGTSPKGEPKEQ